MFTNYPYDLILRPENALNAAQGQKMSSGFHSPFCAGEFVSIDFDTSLVGVVTAFAFRAVQDDVYLHTVEVSYVHNGECKTAWIEATRLTRVERR
jgi:hypothetical protein